MDIQNAIPTKPKKTSHKFYSPEKTGIHTDNPEVTVKIIVGDEESEGRYTINTDTWKVGFKVPSHYHAQHFETFYLLLGEAEWTVGGETHALKPGDAVYIPAHTPHSARTLGDKPAQFLFIYSPGDYEAHLERQLEYTWEQRQDPKVKHMLWKLNDFHLTA